MEVVLGAERDNIAQLATAIEGSASRPRERPATPLLASASQAQLGPRS